AGAVAGGVLPDPGGNGAGHSAAVVAVAAKRGQPGAARVRADVPVVRNVWAVGGRANVSAGRAGAGGAAAAGVAAAGVDGIRLRAGRGAAVRPGADVAVRQGGAGVAGADAAGVPGAADGAGVADSGGGTWAIAARGGRAAGPGRLNPCLDRARQNIGPGGSRPRPTLVAPP